MLELKKNLSFLRVDDPWNEAKTIDNIQYINHGLENEIVGSATLNKLIERLCGKGDSQCKNFLSYTP